MLSCTPAYIGRRMMHNPGIMPKVGAVQVSTGRSLIPTSNSKIGRGYQWAKGMGCVRPFPAFLCQW